MDALKDLKLWATLATGVGLVGGGIYVGAKAKNAKGKLDNASVCCKNAAKMANDKDVADFNEKLMSSHKPRVADIVSEAGHVKFVDFDTRNQTLKETIKRTIPDNIEQVPHDALREQEQYEQIDPVILG